MVAALPWGRWVSSVAAAGTLICASAQEGGQIRNDAERARIGRERAAIESAATAEDAACYQRFAVNDCLQVIRQARRDVLADLRRQEVALNHAEAQSRAAEQILQAEKRFSPEEVQKEAQRLQDAQTAQAERMRALDERIAAREQLRAQEAQRRLEREERLRAAREAQRERDRKAAEAEANRAEYEARQRQAQERQKQAAEERRERQLKKPD